MVPAAFVSQDCRARNARTIRCTAKNVRLIACLNSTPFVVCLDEVNLFAFFVPTKRENIENKQS